MAVLKMKLTDVKNITVKRELDGHSENRYLLFTYDGVVLKRPRSLMIVQAITDEGITGTGTHAHSSPSELFKSNVERTTPMIFGENPFYTERIWDKLFKSMYRCGRKGAIIEAMSATDIALWDTISKSIGEASYKILGTYGDKIPMYARGGYYRENNDVESLVEHFNG